MNINLIEKGNLKAAEVVSDKIIIESVHDALNIMVNCNTEAIILYEKNLTPDFFNLSTRIAGDILQKAANYGIRLALIGDFTKYQSKSLHDFIYESNKVGKVLFVNSLEQAIDGLMRVP